MGKLNLNRLVQEDLSKILEYYERETGDRRLGERFFREYRRLLGRIAEERKRYTLHRLGTRRSRFMRFPYSVVFRVFDDVEIRILFLRHDKRHPRFGMERK